MYVVAFLNFEFHKNQKYAQSIVKRFCDEGHSLTLFGECSVCVWFCWWRGLKFCCELLLSSLKLRSMKVSQKHTAMTSTCYHWSGLLSRRRFNKKRLCFVQFRRFIYNRPPACAQNYFQKRSLGKTGDGSWTYIFRVSIFHTFIIYSVQKQKLKFVFAYWFERCFVHIQVETLQSLTASRLCLHHRCFLKAIILVHFHSSVQMERQREQLLAPGKQGRSLKELHKTVSRKVLWI